MGQFMKQLRVDNNEPITAMNFLNTQTQSNSNHHMLIAHSHKLSILSAADNFTDRHTFRLAPEDMQIKQMEKRQVAPGMIDLYIGLEGRRLHQISRWMVNMNVL